MSNVEKLFDGDQRAGTLVIALEDVIYERAQGLPIATIVGVLDILKFKFLNEQWLIENNL